MLKNQLIFGSCFSSLFNWLLEQISSKSNYLRCWFFELSLVPVLVPFSILFSNFLNIYPLEFDDSQKLWLFWVELSESGLRSGFGWIYIWVFWKEGQTFRDHFLRNFYEKIKFPGSIRDHPRKLPRASGSKNMILNGWEPARTLREHQKKTWKTWKNQKTQKLEK